MSQTDSYSSHRISPGWRLLLAALGLGLLSPLVVATRLKPDSLGHGTHQQLGLPPCTFKMIVGVRCPSCGMTTSWAHMVRGQAWEAMHANAGGALLACMSMLIGPWSLASAARARWSLFTPSETWIALAAFAVIVVTLADWAYRISLG